MTEKRRKDISDKEVVAEFEERRSRLTWLAVIIGVIIGAVSLTAYKSGISKSLTGIILTVSFTWALIVHVKIWRCPACNGHLGRLYLGLKLPKYCPHCGIMLVEE